MKAVSGKGHLVERFRSVIYLGIRSIQQCHQPEYQEYGLDSGASDSIFPSLGSLAVLSCNVLGKYSIKVERTSDLDLDMSREI